MKRFQFPVLLAAFFTFALFANAAQPPPVAPAAPENPLKWDSMEKSFEAAPGEQTAHFSFIVTNTAATNIIINSVYPSCGCTTPSLPPLPWKLTPGTNGEVRATVDLKGKSGNLTKLLTVVSSAGQQNLIMKLSIPKDPIAQMADRQANQNLAKADPQAIFRNNCASCHVTKGVGKMGEELFVASCAICHEPETWAKEHSPATIGAHHRADIVPDLAALKIPMTRQAWKITIYNGKPNSLMPAFAKRHGGPLTDEQIDSLVEFVQRKYPFNPANASTNVIKKAEVQLP